MPSPLSIGVDTPRQGDAYEMSLHIIPSTLRASRDSSPDEVVEFLLHMDDLAAVEDDGEVIGLADNMKSSWFSRAAFEPAVATLVTIVAAIGGALSSAPFLPTVIVLFVFASVCLSLSITATGSESIKRAAGLDSRVITDAVLGTAGWKRS